MSSGPQSPAAEIPGAGPAARTRSAARLAATPDAAMKAREWVCEHLERAGWAKDRLDDVALVVDEAVQNAVEHGSEHDAPVEVRITSDDREARVVVSDRGRVGAEPPLGAPRPVAPSSIRGRGRWIIAALAEEAAWEAHGDGTEVRVRFVAGEDPASA
jgi:anti-sigma regulatory factor (Ser/Thr protein kinase)